jgi:hypothetical protein
MRLNVNLHLELSRIIMNTRFSLNQCPDLTIMNPMIVYHRPTTKTLMAHWDCLLTEYPEPHQTMGYGIPSNTIIQYCSREFESLLIGKLAGQ